jgi:RNA polymerase sigma-70 factor (ECF subfamily)
MDRHSHSHIAAGLRAGDRTAWSRLYEAYAGQVWVHTSRLMADRAAVEDVVQETFLAAARSARGYDPRKGPLWVWLWTIARRQIALHYRRSRPGLSLDAAKDWWSSLDGRDRAEMVSRVEAPIELLVAKELGVLVRHCLAQLPPDYELVLLAMYVDDMSAKEISRQLLCSTVAVRSRIARARAAFKAEFEKVTQLDPAYGRHEHETREQHLKAV